MENSVHLEGSIIPGVTRHLPRVPRHLKSKSVAHIVVQKCNSMFSPSRNSEMTVKILCRPCIGSLLQSSSGHMMYQAHAPVNCKTGITATLGDDQPATQRLVRRRFQL